MCKMKGETTIFKCNGIDPSHRDDTPTSSLGGIDSAPSPYSLNGLERHYGEARANASDEMYSHHYNLSQNNKSQPSFHVNSYFKAIIIPWNQYWFLTPHHTSGADLNKHKVHKPDNCFEELSWWHFMLWNPHINLDPPDTTRRIAIWTF